MARRGTFRFQAYAPQIWKGRYKRVEGNASVFHVRRSGNHILALVRNEDTTIVCESESSSEVKKLVTAVNAVKRIQTGVAGGGFLINEYGQVLVPTSGGPRFYAGQISGILLFRNLDSGEIIDLSNDEGMVLGDSWEMPYLGMVYNLSRSSEIRFYADGSRESLKPVIQDQSLILKLRHLRRSGPVRFLVNPYGIVLTKVPYGEFDFQADKYVPVYAGRINYEKWFGKEEIDDVS